MRALALLLFLGGCYDFPRLATLFHPPDLGDAADLSVADSALSIDQATLTDLSELDLTDGSPLADLTPPPDLACSGSVACWANGNASTAACNSGPAVGSCVDSSWIYCQCGGPSGAAPSAFVRPAPGMPGTYQLIAVADPTWTNLTLNISTKGCWGATATPCTLDQGACGAASRKAWVWPSFTGTAGSSVTFTVFKDDGAPPCDSAGGGTVGFTATFTLP